MIYGGHCGNLNVTKGTNECCAASTKDTKFVRIFDGPIVNIISAVNFFSSFLLRAFFILVFQFSP